MVSKVVRKLSSEYPAIRIAGYQDGFSCFKKALDLPAQINSSGADIVFVAMGAPIQEQWIDNNSHRLNAKAVIGVGGLFDFYSEEVPRAPVWLRELSLEWVWRLAVQPRDKAKRYLIGNPLFLFRTLVATKSQQPSKTEVRHDLF